ncbi:MAG: hypothetical protein AB7S41_09545 [Parvibaculaceae bacterium]
MKLASIAAAAMIVALCSVPAGAAETGTLGQQALKKLFPGSFHAVVSGVYKLRITARRDGSLLGRSSTKSDTGTWSIDGGNLCITFARWMNGRSMCSAVSWDGEWYRLTRVKFRKI